MNPGKKLFSSRDSYYVKSAVSSRFLPYFALRYSPNLSFTISLTRSALSLA